MSPRKVCSLLLGLCQAALLIGGVVLNRLSYQKMGVMRHVTQRSSVWERTLPLSELFLAGTVLLAALALVGLLLLIKRGVSLRWLLLVLFSLGGVALMQLGSTEQFRAFYYLVGVAVAVCLIQLLQCILLTRRKTA